MIDITPPLTDNACMDATLVLEGIQTSGYCGLTTDERTRPQPIRVDLELDCANRRAGETDNIEHTVDYAAIINRVIEISTNNQFHLIESLADHIVGTLLNEFPLLGLRIWVRKTNPPVKATIDSVGVRLARTRSREATRGVGLPTCQPASFLQEHQHHLPKGKILDVATGHGRNALYLGSLGYSVIGIDRDSEALLSIQQEIHKLNLPNVSVQPQNLEDGSPSSLNLGTALYEGIIVFFYLYRPLFPALLRALKQGGVLIYETFLLDNHRINNHPRRPEFCLQPNELVLLTQGLRIVHYEEGARQGTSQEDQTFTARLVARKE